MNLKLFGLVIVALAVVLMAAGCTSDSAAEGKSAPPANVAPVSFSGTGDSVTAPFEASGMTVFKINHDGSRNFILRIFDENGNLVKLLVNEIGPYSGEVGAGLSSGTYRIGVTADGSWSISTA